MKGCRVETFAAILHKYTECTALPSGDVSVDRLCVLVVRVSGYRYRGLGFDSRRYQIF